MTDSKKFVTRAPERLTEESLARGVRSLARRDRALRAIARELGHPPLWDREPGFATLVHIILEQQVSLASARAAFERLRAAGPLTPERFLDYDDAELKAIGFSRQKTAYVRHLAEALVEGRIDLDAIARMPDDDARAELVRLKGVGAWTAEIYLLMALGRPDAWPTGDLALAVAAHRALGLPVRPSYAELDILANAWRPWRGVAARILWHHYLSRR